MITLLALMMLEVPVNICDDVERELIEYNRVAKGFTQRDIDNIVSRCRMSWGPGGSARVVSGEEEEGYK